jgi:hydrogenase-4 component F
MGIIAIGVGLGAAGAYPSMLHALHNTLNKGIVFFLAGFLAHLFATMRISKINGLLARAPFAGVLLAAGLCALSALPPFGTFFSELGIVVAAAQSGQWVVLMLFMLFLAVAFVSLVSSIIPMIFGEARGEVEHIEPWRRRTMLAMVAVLVLLAAGLGTYQPQPVRDALVQAADAVNTVPTQAITLATPAEVQP